MRQTQLISGGRRLSATIFEPGEPPASVPGLLFVHGMSSNQVGYRPRAEACSQRLGALCLTFDLSGHGESDGDIRALSARDHLDDLMSAYDALLAQPAVDGNRIWVCGSSYGAYLAALLSGRHPVARLALRAPALYDDRDLTTKLPERRRTSVNVDARRLFAALNGSNAEVLVIESGADNVIPRSVIRAYLENCPRAEHAVMKRAAHALAPEFEPEFLDLLVHWFDRQSC
ncbi:MAG TPA: alpha/beta fold hydrolase [Pseudonocardiaceae bacterium]|jgi:hypothetical protein